MRDLRAVMRSGAGGAPLSHSPIDPRVTVDLAHLRSLESKGRALNFLPRQPARSALNGRRASRLRGRGLDFEELRGYLPGDDIRTIDWKVTARTGSAHVRVYTEERDRPTLIVVDQRMSMFFGSRHLMKSVTAAEAGALAAFCILAQGDRVGGVVFGDEVVAEFRPERTRRAVDRFLAAIARANVLLRSDSPVGDAMPLNRPLDSVARIARHNHLVIIISDFDGLDDRTEKLIAAMASHNDVVLGFVTDPMAEGLPDGLRLVASDGMLQAEIDATDDRVRAGVSAVLSDRVARVLSFGRRHGISVLPLSSGEDTIAQLRTLLGRQPTGR